MLISGDVLQEADEWAEAHPGELTDVEVEYLERCHERQRAATALKRSSRRNLILAILAGLLLVVGLVVAFLAIRNADEAREAREDAEEQTQVAREQTAIAEDQTELAGCLKSTFGVIVRIWGSVGAALAPISSVLSGDAAPVAGQVLLDMSFQKPAQLDDAPFHTIAAFLGGFPPYRHVVDRLLDRVANRERIGV